MHLKVIHVLPSNPGNIGKRGVNASAVRMSQENHFLKCFTFRQKAEIYYRWQYRINTMLLEDRIIHSISSSYKVIFVQVIFREQLSINNSRAPMT